MQVGRARPRQVREIEPRNAGLRFATAGEERWLDPVRFRLEGGGAAWIAHMSLKEADGGTELLWEADVKRPARGWYNPVHYFMLDEVVAAAERHGLRLQLVLLTRDLYMNALKDSASDDYDRAIGDARRLMRYAVARWGYSTGVVAWEYWTRWILRCRRIGFTGPWATISRLRMSISI